MTESTSGYKDRNVAIIGGGPAGLMAAEALSQAGVAVDVYDAMPSVGRKFLLAGIGGLNITHSEDYKRFCSRYGPERCYLQTSLDGLTPDDLKRWVHRLGIDTFIGTSGRVFPKEMKAAPLLRAWLHRLRRDGVRFHPRHRWTGWHDDGALRIINNVDETLYLQPNATILAVGGASWPKLGSNGAWVSILTEKGINISPLQSANCGFAVTWSEHLQKKFAGAPLKSIAIRFIDHKNQSFQHRGECIISKNGIEGSLIYVLSRALRETINANGNVKIQIDLLPDHSVDDILNKLCYRGSRSLSTHLKASLGLSGVKAALLYEVLNKEQLAERSAVAASLKALPITINATHSIDEAISSAGGVCFDALNEGLMLNAKPGVFIAGEMLDWEAPTGGYLLTASFATGRHAGLSALNWLTATPVSPPRSM